jgi:hypothetical protein
LILVLALTAAPALAQNPGEPPPAGGEASGRPLDGYLATAALAFAALFVVGKSARR